MNSTVIARLRAALEALNPDVLHIEDESHKHIGHAGNSGGGHYTLLIISEVFEGMPLLSRHRLVHEQVDALLQSEIHALSIRAKTPAEHRG